MLHCTPDDPKFLQLTPAQKLWFLLNIIKDKQDDATRLLNLCQHIRPEAYFDKEVAPIGNTSTNFVEDMEEKLGRALTLEEKVALGLPYDAVVDAVPEDDVDTIERM